MNSRLSPRLVISISLFFWLSLPALAQEPAATVVTEVLPLPSPEVPATAPSEAEQPPFLQWLGQELTAPLREREEALHNEVMVMRQEMKGVHDEMAAMRQEMDELRETLDILVREVIQDLRDENDALKDERAKSLARAERGTRLAEMRPEQLEEEVRETFNPQQAEQDEPDEPDEPAELSLEIVEEWGRSAEDVLALGNNAKTLKGMIAVVPSGADLASLEQLGRDLRRQYDGYDNINIEVFDDRAAAEGFKTNQVRNPAHRVLTISKHKDSGSDSIVVYQNGLGREVK